MTKKTFRHHRNPDDIGVSLSPSNVWQATLNIFSSMCESAAACTVFMAAMTAIDHNAGAIMLKKKKLAKALNHPLELIEDAMSDLAALGIFYYSGQGAKAFDRLCMNPRIAWSGTQEDREFRMRISPPLQALPHSLSDRCLW
jgi:hypothetical protein